MLVSDRKQQKLRGGGSINRIWKYSVDSWKTKWENIIVIFCSSVPVICQKIRILVSAAGPGFNSGLCWAACVDSSFTTNSNSQIVELNLTKYSGRCFLFPSKSVTLEVGLSFDSDSCFRIWFRSESWFSKQPRGHYFQSFTPVCCETNPPVTCSMKCNWRWSSKLVVMKVSLRLRMNVRWWGRDLMTQEVQFEWQMNAFKGLSGLRSLILRDRILGLLTMMWCKLFGCNV